jgi:transketolase
MQTMRRRFASVTNELLNTDPRTAVALADIGARDFDVQRHPDRVINVGIREQSLIGITSGLALSGLRPIAHSYTPFLIERPFEQIKLDLSHQNLGAILVSIGASFDAASSGRTHQSPGDVSLMATLPGWTIHVPGHPNEVETMLRRAAVGEDRVYIRLAEDTNSHPHPVTGDIITIRAGSAHAATIIAVGPMLDRVVAATEQMDVTVVYASTVRPLDERGLQAVAGELDVILVEPYLEGTSAHVVYRALAAQPHRLLSVGVPNTEHRRYGTRHQHTSAHGLDVTGLRSRIAGFIDDPAGR